MSLVSKKLARRLEAEAEAALVKEKKMKQLLVRGDVLEEFWWESLTSKTCMEEVLNIKPLKPITARHALGIDVYEAKGLSNRLQINTIGDLFKLYTRAIQDGVVTTKTLVDKIIISTSQNKTNSIMSLFRSLLWAKDLGRWAPPGESAQTKAKADFLHFRHKLRVRERESKYSRGGDKSGKLGVVPPTSSDDTKTNASDDTTNSNDNNNNINDINSNTNNNAIHMNTTNNSNAASVPGSSSTSATNNPTGNNLVFSQNTSNENNTTPSDTRRSSRDFNDEEDVDKDDVGTLGASRYGSLDALLSSSTVVQSTSHIIRHQEWNNTTSVVQLKEEPSVYDGWHKALVQEAQQLRSGTRRKKPIQPRFRRGGIKSSASAPALSAANNSNTSNKNSKNKTQKKARRRFGNSEPEEIEPLPIPPSTLIRSSKRTPLERTMLSLYDPSPSYLDLQPLSDLNTHIHDTFSGELDEFDDFSDDEFDDLAEMMNVATFQRNQEDLHALRTASKRSNKLNGSLKVDLLERNRARNWISSGATGRARTAGSNSVRSKSTSHLGDYISEGTRYSVLRGVLRRTEDRSSKRSRKNRRNDTNNGGSSRNGGSSMLTSSTLSSTLSSTFSSTLGSLNSIGMGSTNSVGGMGSMNSMGSTGSLEDTMGEMDHNDITEDLLIGIDPTRMEIETDGVDLALREQEEEYHRMEEAKKEAAKRKIDNKRTKAVVSMYIKAAQKNRIPLPQALVRLIARRDCARRKRPTLKPLRSTLDDHTRPQFQNFETSVYNKEDAHQHGTIDLSNISTSFDTFASSISSALNAAQQHAAASNHQRKEKNKRRNEGGTDSTDNDNSNSNDNNSDPPLVGLICRSNGLTSDGTARLLTTNTDVNVAVRGNARRTTALNSSTQWVSLDLSSNRIGIAGQTLIRPTLGSASRPSTHQGTRRQHRNNNSGGGKGGSGGSGANGGGFGSPVAMLCVALRSQVCLHHLNLSENKIKNDVAIALSNALVSLPQLKYLELGNNEIGDKGAAALGAFVACSATLSYIGVSWQKVTAGGAACFIAVSFSRIGTPKF